jgi:type I restriction-modification system DNA methylase subunit
MPSDPLSLEELADLDVLRDVCQGNHTGNEENIKIKMVAPVLQHLGYHPIEEFDYEKHVPAGRPDIALLVDNEPALIVESKGLDKDLQEYKQQGLNYATDQGIPWTILTNGVRWDLYKTFIEGVPQDENEPILTIKLQELPRRFDELEEYVGKNNIQEIEDRAEEHIQFVRRKARVSDLAKILDEYRTELFWDLRDQFDVRYGEDEEFTEHIDDWVRQQNTDKKYDWFKEFKSDKKFRSYILNIMSNSGLPDTRTEFEDKYRSSGYDQTTAEIEEALRKEGIPIDWEDQLCFEGAYSFINRVLFLRICEDSELVTREITDETISRISNAQNNTVTVARLESLFATIETTYPGVYALPLMDGLEIGDLEWDSDVIADLLKETTNYDFSELGDVLGHLYQKHLDHNSRRLIGQFYTHEEKVDFILDRIEDQLYEDAKVIDPSCGSGSFLVGVHQRLFPRLLDKGYSEVTAHSHLLKNVIHGVDLDTFAAQLTSINLLIQSLAEPVEDLQIYTGNSLLNYDTLERFGLEVSDERRQVDPREENGRNPDAGSILRNENFDVVVGNPPFFRVPLSDPIYGSTLKGGEYSDLRPQGAEMNIATMFLKKCIDLLKKEAKSPEGRGGVGALILPKTLTYVDEFKLIREYLLDRCQIRSVVDLGKGWPDVGIEHIILIFERLPEDEEAKEEKEVQIYHDVESFRRGLMKEHTISESTIREDSRSRLLLYVFGKGKEIRDEMRERGTLLRNYDMSVWEGIRGDHGVTTFTDRQNSRSVPLLKGKSIRRWRCDFEEYVSQSDSDIPDGIRQKCQVEKKIVIKRVLSSKVRIEAFIDRNSSITHSSTTSIIFNDNTSLEYVVGILNSRLMNLYVRDWLYNRTELTMNFREKYLGDIPIPKNPPKDLKNKIEELVHDLEELWDAEYNGGEIPEGLLNESERIKEKLDQAVYELYGLSASDVEFVEDLMPYSDAPFA